MNRWQILLAVLFACGLVVISGLYFLTPKFSTSTASGVAPLTVTFTTTEGTSVNGSMNPTWINFGDDSPTQPLQCGYQIVPYVCWPSLHLTHTYTKPGTYSVQVVQGILDTVVLQGIDISVK